MDGPDIPRLVAQFPTGSAEDRAALLAFVRQTRLIYGPWKHFKALFKLLEAPALSPDDGQPIDIELLAAVVASLDRAAVPPASPRLVPAPEGSSLQRIKTASGNGFTYSVGLPRSWYSSGWRLSIKPDASAISSAASPLRRALGGLQKLVGQSAPAPEPSANAEPNEAVFDFNARAYIGQPSQISLQGARLSISTYLGATVVDVSDAAFPHIADQAPTPRTMQYMKRRARRLGRALSTENPEQYIQYVLGLWREMGPGPLNPILNWAAMDALFARSPRWKQQSNGQPIGDSAPHFVRLRREERAGPAWDARLDVVRELYQDARVPPQAVEMALKILRANNQPLPPLDLDTARHFLNSDVPLLQAQATRFLAVSWASGEELDGASAAELVLRASGRQRRGVMQQLDLVLGRANALWKQQFVDRMSAALNGASDGSRAQRDAERDAERDAAGVARVAAPSRRRRAAAQVLVARFESRIADETLWSHLEFFLSLDAATREWALGRVRRSGEAGQFKQLDAIGNLPESLREEVMQAFLSGAPQSRPSAQQAFELISKSSAGGQAMGWRFLAGTAMESEEARELWRKVFARREYGPSATWEVAFSDRFALQTWERADFTGAEVARLLDANRAVCEFVRASFFLSIARALPPDEQPRRVFEALSMLQPDVGAQVLSQVLPLARDFAPTAFDLRLLAIASRGQQAAWRFIEASTVSAELLRAEWQRIFQTYFGPGAAALFRRAAIPASEIAAWLEASPHLKPLFSPEFFAVLFELSPPSTQIALALEADDARWQAVRPLLLQVLEDDAALAAFWRAVFDHPSLNSSDGAMGTTGALQTRILSDEEISASLERISAPSFADFLGSANPSHEPFLLRWLGSNLAAQERSSVALIAAATHPLARVRELGLGRVRELGLDVPLALRLMESGLPQPFELGRAFFEAAPSGSEDERDFALALCDSPNRLVREVGRCYVEARREMLLDAALLKRLSEHSDAQVQEFVARYLLQRGGEVDTQAFDASVLRARGRARRAKEAVKQRMQSAPATPESSEAEVEALEALLDVARGRTVRDREWALQQLARRALAGQQIEGLTVKTQE